MRPLCRRFVLVMVRCALFREETSLQNEPLLTSCCLLNRIFFFYFYLRNMRGGNVHSLATQQRQGCEQETFRWSRRKRNFQYRSLECRGVAAAHGAEQRLARNPSTCSAKTCSTHWRRTESSVVGAEDGTCGSSSATADRASMGDMCGKSSIPKRG